MSNVYIRSQNREKLYVFGIKFNAIEYRERTVSKRGKEGEIRHIICISDGCLEELAEYPTKERCLEVLDEIQKKCGEYLYAAGSMGYLKGSTPMPPFAAAIPRLYEMPKE